MKNTLLIISFLSILASCSSKKAEDQSANAQQTIGADTTGLAEFQNYKLQKEQLQEVNLQALPDVAQNSITPVAESPKAATKIIYRDRPVRRTAAVKRYTEPEIKYEEPVYGTPANTGRTRDAVSRNGSGLPGGSGDDSNVGNGTGVSNEPVATSTPAPAKKTGWSKAAKGTAIGAASGAVLGAIVTKGSAKGAIIGGVVGGLGGYAIGRSKDKKDEDIWCQTAINKT